LTTTEEPGADIPRWSKRWTLTYRILAVNILTLALLALSVLYLDAYRNQLSEERLRQTAGEARLIATSLSAVPEADRPALFARIADSVDNRLRLYDAAGNLVSDSWRLTGPTYQLRDPAAQRWTKDAARALDRGFDALVGARPVEDFEEPKTDRLSAWPEAV
jgi:two-component system, OmpR family, sensor histidine kinase ChvG